MATGFNNGVGHELQSCTTEIGVIKVHFLEKSDFDVVFVDTPGFDDTNKSDGEILEMIAQWLKATSVLFSLRRIALIWKIQLRTQHQVVRYSLPPPDL
jgi:GTPase Era involved in 16S rRNA processing